MSSPSPATNGSMPMIRKAERFPWRKARKTPSRVSRNWLDTPGRSASVVLEQLNSRDQSDPMKGHPGYQGDDIDYCAEIVRQVGSPRVKLLLDRKSTRL